MWFLWFLQLFPRTLIAIRLNLDFHSDFQHKMSNNVFPWQAQLRVVVCALHLICSLLFLIQLFTGVNVHKNPWFLIIKSLSELSKIFPTQFSKFFAHLFLFLCCNFFFALITLFRKFFKFHAIAAPWAIIQVFALITALLIRKKNSALFRRSNC